MVVGARNVLRHIWAWRSVIILLLTPLLLLPLPILLDTKEADCAYVVLLMAVYWITESMPIAVTALLPVVLFPLLEILSSNEVAAQYMNDVNMLFLGGLVIAIAIEYWNIHRRVALRILLLVGSQPRWLMLGMMIATWFLSIWISNTATTAMMIPIAEAVLVQLKEAETARKESKGVEDVEMQAIPQSNGSSQLKDTNNHETEANIKDINVTAETSKIDKNSNVCDQVEVDEKKEENTEDDENFKRLCKGMSLSICYSANSGGISSLTGTGPNLAFKAHADSIYQARGLRNPVTFATWMGFGLPLSFLLLIVCWVWLQIAFVRCSCRGKRDTAKQSNRLRDTIQEEYRKLGPIVFGQVVVIVLFLAVVILWITRDLGGVAGWGQLFDPPVKDGAAAVTIVILLFALPSTLPCLSSYKDPVHPSTLERNKMVNVDKRLLKAGPLEIQPILHWKVVHEKMPWHLFLLLGGGYAMSKGCEVSGLSRWIGHELEFVSDWNEWGVLFIIGYVTAAATEVMSNAAMATLLMPIMSQLAISTSVHPLLYMFAAAMACSFAFMLPVATAPNAIVFAYGRVRIIDMASSGLVMNILAVPVLVGVTATVGNAIFDFSNIPGEFLNKNMTAVLSTA